MDAVFEDYLPPALLSHLRYLSRPVRGVSGLRSLHRLHVHARSHSTIMSKSASSMSKLEQFPQAAASALLTRDALQFVVDLHRAALQLEPKYRLEQLLGQRRVKRERLDEAASALREGEMLRDVPLPGGSVALGFRSDTRRVREDPSWSVGKIHPRFDRFHDTIGGAATPEFVRTALHADVSFALVDFEDSSTVALSSLLTGLESLVEAHRELAQLASREPERFAAKPPPSFVVRFEGLHLPSGHFFVDGHPIPAHIVTIGLYLFHCWDAILACGTVPAFYIPKLETAEEAGYLSRVFRTAEELMGKPPRSIHAFIIVENVHAAFQVEEMLFEMRDYAVGCSTGWHDYMASIGAVHARVPHFDMPPKSNLRIVVEHLETYQVALVQVCARRKAIPIGGMTGLTPPKHTVSAVPGHTNLSVAEIDAASDMSLIVRKIEERLRLDFRVQTDRGLCGVWIGDAKLSPVLRSLVADWEALHAKPSSSSRRGLTIRVGSLQVGVSQRVSSLPITHAGLLVTGLKVTPTLEDLEHNMADALQYLASYLAGNGNAALTGRLKSGERVLLLEDAATLERSRREIWSLVAHQKRVLLPNGTKKPLTEDLLMLSLRRVFKRIKDGVGADVPFNLETKIPYDIAFRIVQRLFTDAEPVEYFTVYALKHLLLPFVGNPAAVARVEAREQFPFLRLPNVAPTAKLLFVSNDSFAPASNLLKPESLYPRFQPHCFGAQGQVYDGWETMRHNPVPPDFVVIKLSKPTLVYGVNIDTAHFDGNHGIGGSVEGLFVVNHGRKRVGTEWRTIVPHTLLKPNDRNFAFSNVGGSDPDADIPDELAVVMLRLNMFPDGGIARFEVYGEEISTQDHMDAVRASTPNASRMEQYLASLPRETGFPADYQADPEVEIQPAAETPAAELAKYALEPSKYRFPALVDSACMSHGGVVLMSSSAHYSQPANLIKTARGFNMGDGWETRRNRPADERDVFALEGPTLDYNWTLIQLGAPTRIRHIVIDTSHNVNNSPVAIGVEACRTDGTPMTRENYYNRELFAWTRVLGPEQVHPHREHLFDVRSEFGKEYYTHVLVKIYPCGGMSRIRVFGETKEASSQRARL